MRGQWSTIQNRKIIVNKIGDALADLSQSQNYDPIFLDLKGREERKVSHLNNTNEET